MKLRHEPYLAEALSLRESFLQTICPVSAIEPSFGQYR